MIIWRELITSEKKKYISKNKIKVNNENIIGKCKSNTKDKIVEDDNQRYVWKVLDVKLKKWFIYIKEETRRD